MAIPDYETIMLPLLKLLENKHEHSLRESIDNLANYFELTTEERKELLPSGQQAIFDNRVGWARTYMKKAGLLESTRRGYFRITQRGAEAIDRNPLKIDSQFLLQFKEFVEFKNFKHVRDVRKTKSEIGQEKTPLEELEDAYQNLKNSLADEIIQQFKSCSSSMFEGLVIDLLVAMGYGGNRRDAGEAIGRVGDEGIDGIIKEDPLGLDTIYIQAKCWGNTVGRPEIQKFAGALQGKRAKKGIFITTSDYSKEAYDYVDRIENRIILINGDTLVNLMIDHNLGVTMSKTYEIKRLDLDYFTED